MNEFQPNQKLTAGNLNQMVKAINGLDVPTKDAKFIKTSNGTLFQKFDQFGPQQFQHPRALQISLKLNPMSSDNKVTTEVFMYVPNTRGYSDQQSGFIPTQNSAIKINGVSVNVIIGVDGNISGLTRMSVLDMSLDSTQQKLYDEGKIQRGANAFGWWWTGIQHIVDENTTAIDALSGNDIVIRIAKAINVNNPNDFLLIAIVCKSYISDYVLESALQKEEWNTFTVKVLNDTQTYSFKRIYEGVHPIAVKKNNEQTKGWYSQTANVIDSMPDHDPWEFGNYYRNISGYVEIYRPVFTIGKKQHMLSGTLGNDMYDPYVVTGRTPNELVNGGTYAWYLVNDLSSGWGISALHWNPEYAFDPTNQNHVSALMNGVSAINEVWQKDQGYPYADFSEVSSVTDRKLIAVTRNGQVFYYDRSPSFGGEGEKGEYTGLWEMDDEGYFHNTLIMAGGTCLSISTQANATEYKNKVMYVDIPDSGNPGLDSVDLSSLSQLTMSTTSLIIPIYAFDENANIAIDMRNMPTAVMWDYPRVPTQDGDYYRN